MVQQNQLRKYAAGMEIQTFMRAFENPRLDGLKQSKVGVLSSKYEYLDVTGCLLSSRLDNSEPWGK